MPSSDRDLELIQLARRQAAQIKVRSDSSAVERLAGDALMGDWMSRSLSNYELQGEIRRGGQGVVYRATQRGTRREVAIKVMRAGPLSQDAERVRFQREVHVLGALRHPHIVNIHDSGAADGVSYYIMDYIAGQSLDEYMRTARPSVRQCLQMFADMCDAVAAAHTRGVIHRDLKPGNIRVDATGCPHILDFGLAKHSDTDESVEAMTQTGQFVGSLPWASPEQAEGRQAAVDVRSDVYSLGVVGYQMLTGRFPYRVTGNLREVLEEIASVTPSKPSLHRRDAGEDVNAILLKCLAKEPGQRYQSAGELARDVRRYLAGEPIEARRDSVWYVVQKTLRRHWIPAAVGTAFVLLVTVGFVTSLMFWQQAVRQQGIAEDNAKRMRQEADKAGAVSGFMQNLLTSADPYQKAGSNRSLREVLDQASHQIDSGVFKTQPLAEAAARVAVGNSLRSLGEYEIAEVHLKKALETRANQLGPRHADVAAVLLDLGLLRADRSDFQSAEAMMTMALDIRRTVPERDQLATAASLYALAVLRMNQGRTEEAETYLNEALNDWRERPDLVSVDVAGCLQKLGEVRTTQSRFVESEQLIRDALAMKQQLLGNDHPYVAEAWFSLGALLRLKDDVEGSLEAHQNALRIQRQTLGSSHVAVSDSLHIIGQILREQNRHAEAEAHFRESLEIRRNLFEPTDRRVLLATSMIARVRREQGDLDEAKRLLLEALEGERIAFGPSNKEDVILLADLASLCAERREWDEALGKSQEAIDIARSRGTALEAGLLHALGRRSEVLMLFKQFANAEPLLRECIALRERMLPVEDAGTLIVQSMLGECLGKIGQTEEAEPLLVRSAELMPAYPVSWQAIRRKAIERVIEFYDALGRPDSSAAWRARLDVQQNAASQPSSAPTAAPHGE